MKRSLLLTFFIGIVFFSFTGFGQVITSNGTGGGLWSAGATWVPNTPGGPNSANSTSIVIAAGDVVNADVNVSIDQTTIQGTATLNVNGGVTLTVVDGLGIDLQNNGTLSIAAGGGFPPGPSGILNVSGQLGHNGASITGASTTRLFFNAFSTYDHQVTTNQAIPIASWNATSTCQVSGTNGNAKPGGLTQTFGNFIWNTPAVTTSIDLNGDLSNVLGDLTITSTGSTFSYLSFSSGTNKTINVGGSLTLGSGTYSFITSTATVTLNVGANFSCSSAQFFMNNTGTVVLDVNSGFTVPLGGSFDFTFANGSSTVNVAGDLDMNGTMLKSGTGTSTIVLDGSSTQNLLNNQSTTQVFDIQVGNATSSIFSLGSNFISTGGNYVVSNLATLDMGTGYLAGTGNFNLNSGGTLRVGSTHASGALQSGNSAGNLRVGGTRTFASSSNLIYNGTGAQSIGNGFPTLTAVNLEIDNGSGVTNTAGSTSIIGDLTLTNGAFNINTSSSMDIQSNLNVTSGTFGGSSTSDLTFSGSGTLGTVSFAPGSQLLQNLTISRTGDLQIGSDLTVGGVLSLTGNLDFSDIVSRTLTLNGSMTGNGGLKSNTNSNLIIGGSGAFGIIKFNGTNQLNSATFNTTGTFTWSSTVTINSAVNHNFGALTHSGGLTMANNSTYFKGQGSVSGIAPLGSSYNVEYIAAGTTSLELPTVAGTLNDLTIDAGGTVTLANDVTVNNDLILNGGVFDASTNDITMAGAGRNWTANGGSFTMNSANAVNFTGSTTLGGSSIGGAQFGNINIPGTLNAPAANINVSGAFNNTSTFNAGTGTVTFNGTASSIIGNTTTFHNLSVSNVLTAPSGSVNISGSFTNIGTFTHNNGTVVFNSSSSESIASGGTAFYDLTFNGSGTVSLSSTLDVNRDLTLASGSTLDVTSGNHDIEIARDWINNGGTLNARSGNVIFDGGTMNLNGTGTTDFNDITTSASTVVRVNGIANLGGTLTVGASGTFVADGTGSGTFTIISNATDDGRIGALLSGATVTGNLTFQRYLPSFGAKRWRNIGSALSNATVADIQNEIMISGNFTGNNNIALGLTDPLGPNSIQSLAGYDESLNLGLDNNWVNFPVAINTETFTAGQGYSIWVRETGAVTFDLTGSVNQGNIALPVTGSGSTPFNLVSNPYPSSVDWDTGAGWTKSNIQGGVDGAIHVWDGVQYLVWDGSIGSLGNGRIPMGMAFWVEASTSGIALSINENAKTATTGTVHRIIPSTFLELSLTSSNFPYTDKTYIKFDDNASESFDIMDASKLHNFIFNLSTVSSDGAELSINSVSTDIICEKQMPISITNLWEDTYSFNLSDLGTIDPSLQIEIIDTQNGTVYDLRSGTDLINFAVTSETEIYDTLSVDPYKFTYQIKDRFVLVVRESDVNTNLLTVGGQNCALGLAGGLTINQSEDGVQYNIYSGDLLITSVTGNGDDLIIDLPPEVLQIGDNSFTIKASRGDCGQQEFANPVIVNIIDVPEITYDANSNTLSTMATGSLQWYKDGEVIPGETGSTLSLGISTAEYHVVATNQSCDKSSEIFLVTGLEEDLAKAGIAIYPNPVSDIFQIKMSKSTLDNVLLRVLTINGKVVDERLINTELTSINAVNYESGIYLVEIIDNDKRYIVRLVKQ